MSATELVQIIRDPDRLFPSPVRAAGHLHSTNPCFCTNLLGTANPVRKGTLVLMRPGFGDFEVFEGQPAGLPRDIYVRAGAGARMIDIRNALGWLVTATHGF